MTAAGVSAGVAADKKDNLGRFCKTAKVLCEVVHSKHEPAILGSEECRLCTDK